MNAVMSARVAEKAEEKHQRLLGAMCAQLSLEIDMKRVQLLVLQRIANHSELAVTADLVITLYMLMPGAKDVCVFVKKQGWSVPGAKGPRELCPADVLALVRGERSSITPPADAVLLDMARARFRARGGYLAR